MIQTQLQTPVFGLTQGKYSCDPATVLFHGCVAPHSNSHCFSFTFTTEQRPTPPTPVSEDRRATWPSKVGIQQCLEPALQA